MECAGEHAAGVRAFPRQGNPDGPAEEGAETVRGRRPNPRCERCV